MAKMQLSAPWVVFYREIEQLFKYDNEVHVIYDEDGSCINLYVDNPVKADALALLLPNEKKFGSVTIHIDIIPNNKNCGMSLCSESREDLFNAALNGNAALSFVKTVSGIFANNLTYVVFKNRVVQYFNDDLGDVYGQCSTLYQDIAKHVFGELDGVFYSTDIPEGDKWTRDGLGEWP